jgi:hypothetical protein
MLPALGETCGGRRRGGGDDVHECGRENDCVTTQQFGHRESSQATTTFEAMRGSLILCMEHHTIATHLTSAHNHTYARAAHLGRAGVAARVVDEGGQRDVGVEGLHVAGLDAGQLADVHGLQHGVGRRLRGLLGLALGVVLALDLWARRRAR